jgi:hypothetical protein
MKKKTSLQAKMCEAPTTWLLSSVQLGLGKVPIPPVTKVPSPLKAPTRMYAILLFIFIRE